jgi:hypothetical protein
MSTPDRMFRIGDYLRINMPDMFADPEFRDYLNDPDTTIATWHTQGDPNPHEYSDCFVQFDNGEGSNADMPKKWWDLICEICKAEGIVAGILHITNLDV